MTVKLISLIGGECTGKSQLAENLANELDGVVAADQLRTYVHALKRTPRRDEQRMLMQLQADAVIAAMLHAVAAGKHWVIADPDPFMTSVYSKLYFNDDSLMLDGIVWLRRADVVIWCAPDLTWEADEGVRDGEWAREAADDVIAAALASTGIPVLRTGTERTTHPAWVPDLGTLLT